MSGKVYATIPNDAFAAYRDYDHVRTRCREHLSGCPGGTAIISADYFQRMKGQIAERTRYLALAMAGEAGEAANIVKKEWRGDVRTGNSELDLIKEAADTANYAWMLLTHLGADPIREMKKALDGYEEKMKMRASGAHASSIGDFMEGPEGYQSLRPHTEQSDREKLTEAFRLLDEVLAEK